MCYNSGQRYNATLLLTDGCLFSFPSLWSNFIINIYILLGLYTLYEGHKVTFS